MHTCSPSCVLFPLGGTSVVDCAGIWVFGCCGGVGGVGGIGVVTCLVVVEDMDVCVSWLLLC